MLSFGETTSSCHFTRRYLSAFARTNREAAAFLNNQRAVAFTVAGCLPEFFLLLLTEWTKPLQLLTRWMIKIWFLFFSSNPMPLLIFFDESITIRAPASFWISSIILQLRSENDLLSFPEEMNLAKFRSFNTLPLSYRKRFWSTFDWARTFLQKISFAPEPKYGL